MMTRDEFLARCATIYDTGRARPELFRLMRNQLDAVMRYEHTMFSSGQSQGRCWTEFMADEFMRTESGTKTLANDSDGYELQEIAAILSHHCQQCAEDKNAWWTRSGFCDHKEKP